MPVAAGEARGTKKTTGRGGRSKGRAKRALEAAATAGRNGSEATPSTRVAGLSPAERDVVRALARGLSPKEVASERGTSLATVRTQIKRAKKKAAARTLNELVALVCMADAVDQAIADSLGSADGD